MLGAIRYMSYCILLIMSWQLSSLIFIGIIALSLSSGVEINSYSCPDDSWTHKEHNGIKKCYKLYVAENRIHRCGLKDVCRPLNIDDIPTTIKSKEERTFIEQLVKGATDYSIIVGVYIPCPNPYDENKFVNVDGSPFNLNLFERFDKYSSQYNAMISEGILDDVNLDKYDFRTVLCAITLNPSPCPDNSYKYREINGVGNCYKTYKTPNSIEQCNVINACRSLDPEAIPVTLTSIEQRDFLKTLVDPHVFTLIGVSIPCGHPCNAKAYENVDGTPLPAPLEVTADACPKQVLGMLYKNKTDNLDPKNSKFHGDVLCSIPIYFDCPPGTYPDSKDGRITANTNCVQYVPYVPGSTPEETCAKSNSQFEPPTEIPCSLPHSIEHVPPPPLPYCDA